MIASSLLLAVAVSFQSQVVAVASTPSSPSARRASATRAVRPPVLDGRDDDEVWRLAQPITEFQEFDPDEGKPARFATVAKVAYDEHNFYAFIRAYDPEPQKIQRILARRDVRPPTDQLKIVIDSYHDRRSGYEFAVSPAGVKRDYAIYNDANEDDAWDGVWDVATAVDSLGWTAEFRIPLSQLRYASGPTHTFGFAVWRDIERFKERVSWPLYHRNRVRALVPAGRGHRASRDLIAAPPRGGAVRRRPRTCRCRPPAGSTATSASPPGRTSSTASPRT